MNTSSAKKVRIGFEFVGRGKKLRQLTSDVADLRVQNQTLQLITAGAVALSAVSAGLGAVNGRRISKTRRDFEGVIDQFDDTLDAQLQRVEKLELTLQGFGAGFAQGQGQAPTGNGQQQGQASGQQTPPTGAGQQGQQQP